MCIDYECEDIPFIVPLFVCFLEFSKEKLHYIACIHSSHTLFIFSRYFPVILIPVENFNNFMLIFPKWPKLSVSHYATLSLVINTLFSVNVTCPPPIFLFNSGRYVQL